MEESSRSGLEFRLWAGRNLRPISKPLRLHNEKGRSKMSEPIDSVRLFDQAQLSGNMAPCKHGHINCSFKSGGPYFDEFAINHPELFKDEDREEHDRQLAHDKRIADHVDGYDRDDLGESPDF